jgi:hypothetical protein
MDITNHFITTREAAALAGVTRQAIEYWCSQRPALVVRKEPRLIRADLLREIVAARNVLGRLSAA